MKEGWRTKVKPLLEMVWLVRDCQASETLPVLVHCSAGCGRTGSICVIDYVWGLLKTGKLSPDFSLYALVQEMRRQCIAMVQTVDQYMLCHCSVRELFIEQLRVIDIQYENVITTAGSIIRMTERVRVKVSYHLWTDPDYARFVECLDFVRGIFSDNITSDS